MTESLDPISYVSKYLKEYFNIWLVLHRFKKFKADLLKSGLLQLLRSCFTNRKYILPSFVKIVAFFFQNKESLT